MRLLLVCLVFASLATVTHAAEPFILNSGFEDVAPGNDAPGWGWYSQAAASIRNSTDSPHSGQRCIEFTNASPTAPEVYARMYQVFGVQAETDYYVTFWARGENIGSGIHFTDWSSYSFDVPAGTYGWRKVSSRIRTGDSQTSLNLGINIANTIGKLAIDDVQIAQVGREVTGRGVLLSVVAPGQVVGDNTASEVIVRPEPSTPQPLRVSASITGGGRTFLSEAVTLEPGQGTASFKWNSGSSGIRELKLVVAVSSSAGTKLASATFPLSRVSKSTLNAQLDAVQKRLPEFDRLLDLCRGKKIPVDHPNSARTMVRQFIPLTRADIKDNEHRRAQFAIRDLEASIAGAITQLRAYLKDPSVAPVSQRHKTGEVRIDGLSFIGDRVDSLGRTSQGPLFFCGMGHFTQVRRDIPRWPGYGVNIIQIECGPSAVLVGQDKTSLSALWQIKRVLDEAAKNNVMVTLLLSTHYFPQWAIEKWPHLAQGGGGFLGFCVDEAEAKQVIQQYLRLAVPMFADHPALHSFCLSNEPLFDRSAGCSSTAGLWAEYLRQTHGSLQQMNLLYHSQYKAFEEVPIPGNGSYQDPQFYDWITFVQERFAGWHSWMADVIHEMAPRVPVHAKLMWIPISWRHSIAYGIDPELFAQLSDINGNDCTIWPGGKGSGISWGEQNMFYDLQRSMAAKPIMNTENHLQPDGSVMYVPPEHYRTALWQGAVHGQGATTIWVWERTVSPKMKHYASTVPFYGNVMDRPGCAQATGTTCLDLNRFAEEVTALQNAQAPVAVVYSNASAARNDSYLGAIHRAYTALNFCGVKIDFISEKQLAAQKGKQYKLIVLPDCTHVKASSLEALSELPAKTRLLVTGASCSKDPYNNPHPAEQVALLRARSTCLDAGADSRQLWPIALKQLEETGGLPDVRLVDAQTDAPVWGVEWLVARIQGRTVVNAVNLLDKPLKVKLARVTEPDRLEMLAARDLLSLGGRSEVGLLQPITPVLAEIRRNK